MLARFKSSKLLQNIAAVATGTAGAQAIVFAFSLLITRIYSPEIFGLQGIFSSLIGIMSPAIALRLPLAIVTARSEEEALVLKKLSLWIALGLSVLLLGIFLIGGQPDVRLLGAESLGLWVLILPLALLCTALQTAVSVGASLVH